MRSAAGFHGGHGQSLWVERDELPVLLLGLGAQDTMTLDGARTAAAHASRMASHLSSMTIEIPEGARVSNRELSQALAEGCALGNYSYPRGNGARRAGTAWLPAGDISPEGWAMGSAIGAAVNDVRDLVNTPPNSLTPDLFADYTQSLAEENGLRFRKLAGAELVEGSFGGIVAVGAGSEQRPCLVELSYGDPTAEIDICLVGKGITFDSGGLSLKSPDALIDMKSDMAGAAAVLGAMTLIARVAPNLRVAALLPLAENMPSGGALRPGDVVTMRNGKTVEVLNTDFEGRLVLADALAFAAESAPRAIVDLATLTYASTHALGPRTAALLGNDSHLLSLVEQASAIAGEAVWPLPMPEYLRPQIVSRVADLKNFPGAITARTSTAAMFLREFVPETIAWAHLDIAGPAWSDVEHGVTPVGATGYGMRTLLELLKTL